MSNLNVIGLIGPAGCGKTTMANILVAQYGYVRVRVAGVLKDMLRTMGLTEAQIDGDQKELPCALLGGQTPRWAMQTLGTEWGRDLICQDIWVRATSGKLERLLEQGRSVVIDDIRFTDEATMVRELEGSLYRVTRTAVDAEVTHTSEGAWRDIPVDGIICNEFDMINLQMQVRQLFDITLEENCWTHDQSTD